MKNRFLEMDQQLSQIAEKCNGRKLKAISKTKTFANVRQKKYSKPFEAVDYTVPGIISPLRQPSNMTCWATVTTMMMMWKQQASMSIETALSTIGNLYLTKFRNNQGLTANEKEGFLRASGLQFEYPQSYSIEGWKDLLLINGPIWVTTDEDPSVNFAIHARIISAIQGDGTPENTYFTIIDPARGNQYREEFSNFLTKYEQEVRDSGVNWSGRIQIVHWPPGTGVSFSRSNSSSLINKNLSKERTQTWSVSQTGIDLIKSFEGFRTNMYNDPVGHCTIGYGTLLHTGNCNGEASEQPFVNGITEERATQLLFDRMNNFQRTINDSVKVELNQNQNDSLVSFVYNIGSNNFRNSTLLKLLNQGNYNAVPSELRKWINASQNGQLVVLPGLVRRRNAEAELFSNPTVSSSQSIKSSYSRPFYDTGEHAIFGEFINSAISGPLASVYPLLPTTTYQINTVPFTYGQIITLGDFYETFLDCQRASAIELNRLKNLINRSENHYKNIVLGIGSRVSDVTTADWSSPTTGIGQRYLDLALANNSHFAPPPTGTSSTTENNKQMWERYHREAINIARLGTSSDDLDRAYPVNAFGDHFLTDAFSSGHLINKEYVLNLFIQNVITNGSVNSAGDRMLERIADSSLAVPEINRKLGKFEVISSSWYEPNWDLNDTGILVPEVFYRILKRILQDTATGGRQKIANLAVKAVHDYLNNYRIGSKKGVPVRNNKGNSWNLTGDGTLDIDNIRIVQLAVKQSVENLEDSITNTSTPLSTFYQRVWDYLPNPSDPTTSRIVSDAVNTYTNPSSDALIRKAVSLIGTEIDTLLNELLTARFIQCKNNTSARSVAECR